MSGVRRAVRCGAVALVAATCWGGSQAVGAAERPDSASGSERSGVAAGSNSDSRGGRAAARPTQRRQSIKPAQPRASTTIPPGDGALRAFFGDGSAEKPDAGLIWGNGYSWTAQTCPAGPCSGGDAGLFGNGGNGYNGGHGGAAGWFGKGGDGGHALTPGGAGGNGGSGGMFLGSGGRGGNGAEAAGVWQSDGPAGVGGGTGILSVWGEEGDDGGVADLPAPDGPGIDGLAGRDEADAATIARDRGLSVRIVARDGEWFPVTKDYRLDRVNFVIENGVVVEASIG